MRTVKGQEHPNENCESFAVDMSTCRH